MREIVKILTIPTVLQSLMQYTVVIYTVSDASPGGRMWLYSTLNSEVGISSLFFIVLHYTVI